MKTPDELTDPALQEYANALEDLYARSQLPPRLSWEDLQARRTAALSRPALPFIPRRLAALPAARRLSWRTSLVLGIVSILLMGSGIAYGTGLLSALLNKDIQAFSGTDYLLTYNKLAKINKSQTIHGFTVTLETGYADANRVVLGYSLKTPDLTQFGHGGIWFFTDDSLQTSKGQKLPELSSVGTRAATNVISYDAAAIQGTPGSLSLRAHISFGCGSDQPANGPVSNCTSQALAVSKALNWTFQFKLPFHPGRVIPLHQTQTSQGYRVTLDRLVLTDSETRIYFSGPNRSSESDPLQYMYDATLTANGLNYGVYQNIQQPAQAAQYLIFDNVLVDQHGAWELDLNLNINKLSFDGSNPASQSRGHSAWKFKFQVP